MKRSIWFRTVAICTCAVALCAILGVPLLHVPARAKAPVGAGNDPSLAKGSRFGPAGGTGSAPGLVRVSGGGERLARGLGAAMRPQALAFEPNVAQTGEQAKFLAHGRGYGLFLTGNEVVLALASRQSSVLSHQFKGRPWSDVRGPFQRATHNPLRIGLISSTFPSRFGVQNSESSPAPNTQHLAPSVVRLRLVGANPNPKVIGLDKLKGISNYFIGNDPKKWRTNVPNYARVMVKDVYPGIDQIFYGRESGVGGRESGELEFDFIVHPGADPKAIRLAAETQNWKSETGKWKLETGNSKLETSPNGDLVLQTDAGEVRLGKPLVFQEQSTVHSQQPTVAKDKGRKTNDVLSSSFSIQNSEFVQGSYALTAENQIAFSVPSYDRPQTLVIDPTLKFISTFGGSEATEGHGVALDTAGNTFIAGFGGGTGFPTTPGAFQPTGPGGAFVQKIDPSGALIYSTYFSGSSALSMAFAVAIDSSGDAYVTGQTSDTDFPVLNAFQPALAGADDAFVTEFNPTGSALVYSSYLGGSLNTTELTGQTGYGIALDAAGNAYVTGYTRSADFPTLNAFQPVFGGGTCGPAPCDDAFVTKVAPRGGSLVYSTFLGGSEMDDAFGIALDTAGNAYVTGASASFNFPVLNAFQASCVPTNGSSVCTNAFATELDPSGSALVFSTYLGGSCADHGQGAALDTAGDIYVTGYTCSTDFPTANAFQPTNASAASTPDNAFLTEFVPGGASLVYSTYLGGSGLDNANAVAVDSLGEAFITGITSSTNFPLSNPLQATYGSATYDAFVAGFQAGGKGLIYSTYLGGTSQSVTYGYGIAVDAQGDAWVTGTSNATTFVAAISRPEAVHREVAPRPQGSTSSVTAALAGSIALDMARVHAAPASLAFGYEVVGTTSAPETVTISNPGTAPLTFSAISASDSFTVPSGGTCSTSSAVAPGGSCTVDVAFAPTVGGSLTGTLTLTDNGIGSPHTIPLSGTGQDFTVSTDKPSASVAAGGSATFNLSVAPQGGFNHSLDLSCTDPAPASTCSINPATVTPNAQFVLTPVVSITTTAPSQVAPRGPKGPGPIAGHRPALQLWPGTGRPRGAPLLIMLAWLAVAAMSSSPRVAALLRRRRPHLVDSRWSLPSAKSGGGNDVGAGMTEKPQSFWTGRPRGAPLRWPLALGLLLVLAWAACGGGGQPGTPAGTYTVTLKALDTQANLSHATTVTLTVH